MSPRLGPGPHLVWDIAHTDHGMVTYGCSRCLSANVYSSLKWEVNRSRGSRQPPGSRSYCGAKLSKKGKGLSSARLKVRRFCAVMNYSTVFACRSLAITSFLTNHPRPTFIRSTRLCWSCNLWCCRSSHTKPVQRGLGGSIYSNYRSLSSFL
ncbi:hypothetical protein EVAR_42918_1 [Eumeta japonica]|uniref:Uncharacterized protein n=1 Tax=Eumeta variegata TaxID=151549 RepID=A0A4C1WTK5_EUMVA|nr:hypothetical protein EVAR_42918_1 [Eumeta japonica]